MSVLQPNFGSAIVALDESTSNNYVTSGALYVLRKNVEGVLSALNDAKTEFGVDESAKIHCRILFAGDKRKKAPSVY